MREELQKLEDDLDLWISEGMMHGDLHTTEAKLIQRAYRAIKDRRAALSQSGEAEPVAYGLRSTDKSDWGGSFEWGSYLLPKSHAEVHARDSGGKYEAVPLYAAPPPEPAVGEDVASTMRALYGAVRALHDYGVTGQRGTWAVAKGREAMEKAAPLLSRLQQQGCPEGWKCVPVEPTDWMQRLGIEVQMGWENSDDYHRASAVKQIWTAMLSAVPEPERAGLDGFVMVPQAALDLLLGWAKVGNKALIDAEGGVEAVIKKMGISLPAAPAMQEEGHER